ncbi:exosortase/archaeosortase family protein [Luteolibacter luteus]|uniref:Exosortase/archaeosortase family protein n=1 Tax=Luteolibacter luteus TaxID=2728835 RepID=A0A858RLD0_9BACT|nr:exosortase/archaeosortase family protein [Luteolibacter luteus]QJE96990.1 exosortase/archaeosortase family protein [Luteolibacter luteus]
MESSKSQASPAAGNQGVPSWLGPVLCGLIIAIFYFVVPGFGNGGHRSPLYWLESTWNKETDYEHGYLVPVIMIGLIAWQWKNLRRLAAVSSSNMWGLPILFLGIALFVAGHRCGQARLSVGGLPMILWGSTLYLWGWQVARLTFFPLFFLWLAIPVPEFQQATTKLQIMATKLAQWGSNLFGVKTVVQGTQIFSANDRWAPLKIDEGCGGIRSLMALIMISSVWAYIAKVSLWKKALLCLAAFPLAILGNMMRLTSIFVIAEYGDPEFAANTWHDWSGLVIFYPISLVLLMIVHSALEQGVPWRRPRKKQVRTVVVQKAEAN